MPRLFNLFHTFTFRLALVYVALFSLSVVILFGFIYGFASSYLENQVIDSIRVRYGVLRDEYRENGSVGLKSRIGDMVASDDEGTEIYLLINAKNERLAGNLNEWPEPYATREGAFEKEGRWLQFSIQGTRNHPASIEVKAVAVPLSKWRTLLVGQSLQNTKKVEQIIAQAFWASLLLTLGMALAGAVIMTRSVMGRLSAINRTAERIMEGELSTRIPFTPGGDEFDELSHRLNRMLDKIAGLLESLSQFANNLAHDLRSPLNRIVARTEAGLRGLKEQSAARRLLEQNVDDMQELIGTFNSILLISELEASTGFPAFEPCDLTRIITRLVEFYEPYASEKNLSLVNHLEEELRVEGEKNLLTQAFANLIDNALKFTPAGGRITISGAASEQGVEIVVADTGPGIPEAMREKVFEKFFRLEESRSAKGNGLGLSLVAATMRMHGAEIFLRDNAPGLRVHLRFPKQV